MCIFHEIENSRYLVILTLKCFPQAFNVMLSFLCEKVCFFVIWTEMLSLKLTSKPVRLRYAKFYWFFLILVSLLLEIRGYLTKPANQYFLQKKSTICWCTLNICTWAIGRLMLSTYTKKTLISALHFEFDWFIL